MKRTLGSRAIGRAWQRLSPTTPNTMIAFAAKAGSTASDGASRNSPFATALVDHLPKPGLDLRKAFRLHSRRCDESYRQQARALCLRVPRRQRRVAGAVGCGSITDCSCPPSSLPGSTNADARRDYDAAVTIGTQAVWEAFIVDYPRGLYTELAKAQRAKLLAEEARSAAAERSRIADEEKARLAADGARAAEQAKAAESREGSRRGSDRCRKRKKQRKTPS